MSRPAPDALSPKLPRAKVLLYLALAPEVTALATDCWALARKAPTLAAEPATRAAATRLADETRRLLRGAPEAALCPVLPAAEAPQKLHALALGLNQLARALEGFRARHCRPDPDTGAPRWDISDSTGPLPAEQRPLEVELAELNRLTAAAIRTVLIDLGRQLAPQSEDSADARRRRLSMALPPHPAAPAAPPRPAPTRPSPPAARNQTRRRARSEL